MQSFYEIIIYREARETYVLGDILAVCIGAAFEQFDHQTLYKLGGIVF